MHKCMRAKIIYVLAVFALLDSNICFLDCFYCIAFFLICGAPSGGLGVFAIVGLDA